MEDLKALVEEKGWTGMTIQDGDAYFLQINGAVTP